MSEYEQREIFKNNLNRLLKTTPLNQKEIAEKIGVSPQTFNTWCQGKAIPRMGKIQKLADFFNINKSDLINEHIETEETGYYLNPETAELAQEVFERPELKLLFDASRKATKEDIQTVIDILNKFNK